MHLAIMLGFANRSDTYVYIQLLSAIDKKLHTYIGLIITNGLQKLYIHKYFSLSVHFLHY